MAAVTMVIRTPAEQAAWNAEVEVERLLAVALGALDEHVDEAASERIGLLFDEVVAAARSAARLEVLAEQDVRWTA